MTQTPEQRIAQLEASVTQWEKDYDFLSKSNAKLRTECDKAIAKVAMIKKSIQSFARSHK